MRSVGELSKALDLVGEDAAETLAKAQREAARRVTEFIRASEEIPEEPEEPKEAEDF
jgi:hypothetical protein